MATSRTDSSSTAGTDPLKGLVGRNIALARGGLDWSQLELASRSGINDAQRISKWERGVYMPSSDALMAIAKALGKELAWFFAEHKPLDTKAVA